MVLAAVALGQGPPRTESEDLREALAEAAGSTADFTRALERHLEKYPDSPRRSEFERALVRAALEGKDNPRIIRYGERVLERQPEDIELMDHLCRALLASGDKASAEKALGYARKMEGRLLAAAEESAAEGESGRDRARWKEESDESLSSALLHQARAQAMLDRPKEAVALARRAFQTLPGAEAAREAARSLIKLGLEEEALRSLADAFALSGAEASRAADRARLGEIYRRRHGSEKGLGDLLLEAYDRVSALQAERRLALKALDPNAQVTDPMGFTLTGLDGETLALATLKGKIVVMDFWATWCGPCRVQKPLYDRVKQRFRDRPEVVFLAVNTDEDRTPVKDFVEDHGWSRPVWFEDGLAALLRVNSIPTTVVFDRQGALASRMDGFEPDRFVDTLSARIEALLR